MVFALFAPYSKFSKDVLMIVNWPKHVVMLKIKIYCCGWLKPENILLFF